MSDEYYRAIETRLGFLLGEASEGLSAQRAQEVADFIDSSEFGVALTWLAHSLKEANLPIREELKTSIKDLAEVMGIAAEIPTL